MAEAYQFSNGVKLRRSDLLDLQIARYAASGNPNLHEPVEERWLLETFARDIPSVPIFLDVGAAVGYYSILIKKSWPNAKIVCIEPLPKHIEALRESLPINGLAPTDITLLPVAISISDGIAPFVDGGYGSGLAAYFGTAAPSIRVNTRTLTSVLNELENVHLMKMDIQGGEYAILNASRPLLSEGRIKHLVIGTHGPQIHHAVVDIVKSCGYKIAINDPSPPMQPDGLIVASRSQQGEGRR
jgi:FkbM family methyltransferase